MKSSSKLFEEVKITHIKNNKYIYTQLNFPENAVRTICLTNKKTHMHFYSISNEGIEACFKFPNSIYPDEIKHTIPR